MWNTGGQINIKKLTRYATRDMPVVHWCSNFWVKLLKTKRQLGAGESPTVSCFHGNDRNMLNVTIVCLNNCSFYATKLLTSCAKRRLRPFGSSHS